jgi:RNA polymerase sigma factor (sigma-70 family)
MDSGPLGYLVRHLRGIALREDAARPEDAQLLERFVGQRDEAAFEALLRRHGPMVLGVCRRLLPDSADAEDAFQATFLVLLRKAGSLREGERVGPWLYGVARRTALKARTSAARRRAHEKRAAAPPEVSPADDAARRDVQTVLDDEVSRLPEKYRAPVVLCYLEGRTFTEAAQVLGWPAGTVSGRLARARELLRKRLSRRGLGTFDAELAEQAPAALPPSLMASTARAAAALAAGAQLDAGVVSPAVATLTEGVLQAMFLKQLKVAVTVVVVLVALAAGGVIVYPSLSAQQSPAKQPEKPSPAAKGEDKLNALLKERVEVAKQWLDERHQEYLAGRGTLDILFEASRELVHAEQELSGNKADRIAALEAHLKLTKDIEEINRTRFDAGRLSRADMHQSTYYRLEAEIWLEREKAK